MIPELEKVTIDFISNIDAAQMTAEDKTKLVELLKNTKSTDEQIKVLLENIDGIFEDL
jgi:hypothetical protein